MNSESVDNARDTALLALRPVLAEAPSEPTEDTAGDFLHRTLRPVLKLQNDVLLASVADFVRDHHIALAAAGPADQLHLTAELLARNLKLRSTVTGMVSGLFTSSEFAFYRRHRGEINRRILELATRRVQTQMAALLHLVADAE